MTNLSILTPEDILSLKSVTDAQISLDGEFVAFVLGDQYVEGTKFPRSNVWIATSDGKDSRQLTSGSRADTTPRWSPDGKTLAFCQTASRTASDKSIYCPETVVRPFRLRKQKARFQIRAASAQWNGRQTARRSRFSSPILKPRRKRNVNEPETT